MKPVKAIASSSKKAAEKTKEEAEEKLAQAFAVPSKGIQVVRNGKDWAYHQVTGKGTGGSGS